MQHTNEGSTFSYTKSQIPIVMMHYFMAIMTYYSWKIGFKDLILECSKLLNYLEGAKVISCLDDKRLAATELVKNINMAMSEKMEKSMASQIVNALTNDHTTKPDSHTFAIDELFDLYNGQHGL